jgi:NAD(P)-dependent dehydrogenase (short-subunit alcohol dehydrogenase family)
VDCYASEKAKLYQIKVTVYLPGIRGRGTSTYSASRAASYSLTQGLRDKLGEKGFTVVSVHPGPIDTQMAATKGFDGCESTIGVSEGIVNALREDDFRLFPDTMAKQFEGAYQSFSDSIVMADFSE